MRSQALFLFLIPLLLGAGPKPSIHSSGDPMVFIDRARNLRAIPLDALVSLEGWWIHRLVGIPFEQTPRLSATSPIKIDVKADTVMLNDSAAPVRLKFAVHSGAWVLTEALGRPAQLVHFSMSTRHDLVSLLWRDLRSGKLIGIYLAPASRVAAKPLAPQKFAFEFPPGGRWREKQVDLQLCGFRQDSLKAAALRGIAHWQAALTGKLIINVGVQDSEFPPFSDLNKNCIYWIDGYRQFDQQKKILSGASYGVPSADGAAIADSDIFLFSAGILNAKYPQGGLEKAVESLVTHEVGHWLGLAHPYDAKIPSVLNYQDRLDLTEYDLAAIRALYPEN